MNAALRARIGTALLLAALVIVVLAWLPAEVAVAMIAVAIFAAGYEWAGFARLHSVPARLAFAAAILRARRERNKEKEQASRPPRAPRAC